MKNRLKKSSVSLIAILLMVILIVLPTGYEDAVIFKGTDKIKAKVVSTDESTVKSSGLIQSGEGLWQVTWMDVRVGDILPTPRHGKPVENQCLLV